MGLVTGEGYARMCNGTLGWVRGVGWRWDGGMDEGLRSLVYLTDWFARRTRRSVHIFGNTRAGDGGP